MNVNSSFAQSNEHGHRFDGFLVRSFRGADRQNVLSLHVDSAPAQSVPCDCTANIDRLQEKYLHHSQNHFWVAEVRGKILGTVGICVQNQEVSHLHCLRAVEGPMS